MVYDEGNNDEAGNADIDLSDRTPLSFHELPLTFQVFCLSFADFAENGCMEVNEQYLTAAVHHLENVQGISPDDCEQLSNLVRGLWATSV